MSPSTSNSSAGPDPAPVDGDLQRLQQVVSLGKYEVDCDEVARAMLDRINTRTHVKRADGRVLRRALTDLQAV